MTLALDLDRPADQIREQLRRVLARFPDAGLNIDRLEELASSGEIQVFPVGRVSVYVCTLRGDWAYIEAGAGDLDEIMANLPGLCDWYAEHGARTITLRGREGWRRVLGPLGWKPGDREGELTKALLPSSEKCTLSGARKVE